MSILKRNTRGVSPLNADNQNEKPPLLGGVQLQAAIRVNRSPDVCYRMWRDFKNLPRFMRHVYTVSETDERHSHWTVAAPGNSTAEWDAVIIEDIPNQRISWRSLTEAQIDNAGSVSFSPQQGGRRTDVKVALAYNPPMGAVGEAVGGLFGERPDDELADDLVLFKIAAEMES